MENIKADKEYKNIKKLKIDYDLNRGININDIKMEIFKALGFWTQRLEYKISVFYEDLSIKTKVFIKYDKVRDRSYKIDILKKDINESRDI